MSSARPTILSDGYMPRPPLPLAAYREAVGREVGRSDWIAIDQAMIDAFAALTGDNQYIHVDPSRARLTSLGGTVAHGFLTLALIGGLGPKTIPPIVGTTIGYNYGFNAIRFVSPVPSGARIRAIFTGRAVTERPPGQILLAFDVKVEIEDKPRPALVAEWLTLMVSE
jgi:acyl dehydratase